MLQAAQELHKQLRHQDFELYAPNPRMLPREFNPRKLHANVTSTSPAKEEASGPSSGRGRGGRRSGSAGANGRGRGRGRGAAGRGRGTVAQGSAMAAATAEPAADAAAVSPRSQWRGPPKPHERAAAARRGRPASATQQEVLDTGMEQGQAPLQAKPMSLKERIAANAALRASNEQPVGTANPEKQAPTEKQLDNGVERGAEWEMALALGNDSMEPEQLEALPTAGTEKACMVQVLPQPKLTEVSLSDDDYLAV